MLAATLSLFDPRAVSPCDQATTGPVRKKRRAPVFIHDAVLPWRGETMLLSLLRAQAEEAARDRDQP